MGRGNLDSELLGLGSGGGMPGRNPSGQAGSMSGGGLVGQGMPLGGSFRNRTSEDIRNLRAEMFGGSRTTVGRSTVQIEEVVEPAATEGAEVDRRRAAGSARAQEGL